jgi:hypothetical protein
MSRSLISRVLLLWIVETLLNVLAAAIWASQGRYNHDSPIQLVVGALPVYASLKAVFHLPLYFLAYLTIIKEVLLGSSIGELLRCHLILFSFISFTIGTIFAWNMFYNDWQLATLLLASSALAVLLTGKAVLARNK